MNPTLQGTIDRAWEARASLDPSRHPEVRDAVEAVITALDSGELRVAEKKGVGEWSVNQWIKKAVLLSFRLTDSKLISAGGMSYFDKVDSKFSGFDEGEMRATGVRTVPPAMIRHGAYLARDVGAFHEAVTNTIVDDIVAATRPRFVRIVARWNVRGGITTNVVAEYRKPGWTAADPVVLPLDSDRGERP